MFKWMVRIFYHPAGVSKIYKLLISQLIFLSRFFLRSLKKVSKFRELRISPIDRLIVIILMWKWEDRNA
jgi:hypothetical protein